MALPKLLSKLFQDSGAGDKLNPGILPLPVGAIMAFSGSFDSAGHPISGGASDTSWRLCDGGDGTPDLRGKFILGVSASHAAGTTGGEESHTLTTSEMPSHTHRIGISQGWLYHDTPNSFTLAGDVKYDSATNRGKAADGCDSYVDSQFNEPTGGNAAHNNMPPFYALSYIMKVS